MRVTTATRQTIHKWTKRKKIKNLEKNDAQGERIKGYVFCVLFQKKKGVSFLSLNQKDKRGDTFLYFYKLILKHTFFYLSKIIQTSSQMWLAGPKGVRKEDTSKTLVNMKMILIRPWKENIFIKKHILLNK